MSDEIANVRAKSGLSQSEFALALRISTGTLKHWEQGRRKPSGPARALIEIAFSYPEIIREKFEANREKQTVLSETLDKMADELLSGEEIAFSDRVLDWYRSNLECGLVPRPVDKDHVRLAVKASVLERLTEVFNMAPHNRDQEIPIWCKSIGKLNKPLKLQSDRLLEDELYCKAFEKRNLFVVSNFMFFI